MRVTGGALKGRVFKRPPGVVRPAMDRMRESVFAVLGDLGGRSFLDLFSGSGVVALEALSRGAFPVVLVEKDPLKRDTLLAAAALGEEIIGKPLVCRFVPAERFLARLKTPFDVIFCDPPFPYRFRESLVETVSRRSLLTPQGLLLVHRPREAPLPEDSGALTLVDRREYGRSIVDFYGVRGE